MKKFALFTSLVLSFLLFSACETELTEDKIDELLEDYVEDIDEEYEEFEEEHSGKSNEVITQERYDELVEQYGMPSEYFKLYDYYDEVNWPHAYKISVDLGLDYYSLAYIQSQSGTYGLQRLLESMDQTNDAVSATTSTFQDYHEITNYDPELVITYVEEGATPEETAYNIIKLYSAQYELFYPSYSSLPKHEEAIAAIQELVDWDTETLAWIIDHGFLNSIAETLPEDFEHKEAIWQIGEDLWTY